MTDNDLIAKLETYVALQRERPNEPMAIPDLAAEVAVVLRARDTELAAAVRERDSLARRCAVRFEESEKLRAELAAARAVTRRFLDGWYLMPGAFTWWKEPYDGRGTPSHEPMSDAERAWLASVSPPADRPTAHGDPGPPPVVPRPPAGREEP